jgi:hypothetical protein
MEVGDLLSMLVQTIMRTTLLLDSIFLDYAWDPTDKLCATQGIRIQRRTVLCDLFIVVQKWKSPPLR